MVLQTQGMMSVRSAVRTIPRFYVVFTQPSISVWLSVIKMASRILDVFETLYLATSGRWNSTLK